VALVLIKPVHLHPTGTPTDAPTDANRRPNRRQPQVFVDKCDGDAMEALLAGQYVPLLLDPLLGDYARSPPDAR
jgi:hypothetical protein